MGINERVSGSYSLEGALALTVFTACLMALLSILSVLKVEAEVQDALNETALELSQYSYVCGRSEYLKDAAAEHLEGLKELLSLEDMELTDLSLAGPAAAKLLTKQNFSRDHVDDWLKRQGVVKGYGGLNFMDTQVLMDGKTIRVAVHFPLEVQTFGMFHKTLTIRESAVTYGLLPTTSALKRFRDKPKATSIWQETNFARGRYFAESIRADTRRGAAVKPGQGIDLYDAPSGMYLETYSMNVFLPTYASFNAEEDANGAEDRSVNPASFKPLTESIEKTLFGYARDLNKDLAGLSGEVVLADGTAVEAVPPKEKILLLIVPEETKQNDALWKALTASSQKVQAKFGVQVEIRMEQKAFL